MFEDIQGDNAYCPECGHDMPFVVSSCEATVEIDGVSYRYLEKTATCVECGTQCVHQGFREQNAKAFNDAVRLAHSCIPQWKIDALFDVYGESLSSLAWKTELEDDSIVAIKNGVCPSRADSERLASIWLGHALGQGEDIPLVAEIRSGGQSGVDRAAFDAARDAGLPICGWCPAGGWAEDMEEPPGLLGSYPEMIETPSCQPEQRTVWNVRDADAVLVYYKVKGDDVSVGTNLAESDSAERNKPIFVADCSTSPDEVADWLEGLGRDLTLSIGGPRESESPGIYGEAKQFLAQVYATCAERKEKSFERREYFQLGRTARVLQDGASDEVGGVARRGTETT